MLGPWKKSYDKPRQHIKKQRHYFAGKGPSSQGYGFSSSHVWVWELDHKKGWALKNWCFWTVVLEKTFESHLDCQEMKPVNSVQFNHSVVSDSLRPHESQHARPPCPSNSRSLPNLMSIESVMPSSHLILCRPLFLLPPILPRIRIFSNESTLHMRWPKYWSFSFSISPSNEHPGLISFRMDWLDLLAVQGTLKSLLQHHNSKASILWRSAFFTVQLSYPYMTTVKTIALTRWTFVGKVMSFLLNMLSRLVITFLPRSKRLLISWLQSPSAVILEPPKIKSDTVSTVSPSICPEVMGPEALKDISPEYSLEGLILKLKLQ